MKHATAEQSGSATVRIDAQVETPAGAPVRATSRQLGARPPSRGLRDRVGLRIGRLWIDAVTLDGALEAIETLVARGAGGGVHTPNVDHIVLSERSRHFADVYARADLTLADGVPVVWASRLLGAPLPAKLSGADLMWPLARYAAARGWRVYLLGGLPGAAAEAARRFQADCGLEVVGVDDSRVSLDRPDSYAGVVARIRAAEPDLVLVAYGAPKQELWIDRVRESITPAVSIGVGASLDFVAGRLRRAPAWMSRVGLEWLFRLCQEPRRLWRRYLVQDPMFLLIVLRTLRERRQSGLAGALRLIGPDSDAPNDREERVGHVR